MYTYTGMLYLSGSLFVMETPSLRGVIPSPTGPGRPPRWSMKIVTVLPSSTAPGGTTTLTPLMGLSPSSTSTVPPPLSTVPDPS